MAETWYAMVVLEGSLVSLQISCQARHVEEVSELAVIGRGIGDSTTAVHAPPLLRISAAIASRRPSVRPTMKTDFPSRARRRETAAPTPSLAPTPTTIAASAMDSLPLFIPATPAVSSAESC